MTDKPIDTFLAKLSGCRPSGDSGRQWAACCPAHGDAHQSLGVGVTADGRVLLKCYAGCSVEDIVAAVGLTTADLFPGRKERVVKKAGVTVTVLAWEKRLDPKFLRDECGLVDDTTGSTPQVLIQYRDRNGEVMFSRRRLAVRAKDGTRQPRGTKLRPYGLWRLQQAAETGVLIIPEGESDAWALWSAGYPALGLPGADAANALQADDLAGVTTVYVWRDKPQKPDDVSGQHFVARVHARVKELRPEARVLVLSDPDHKDPSELLQKFGYDFRKRMDERIAAAEIPPAGADLMPPAPVTLPGERLGAQLPLFLTDLGNAHRLVKRHGHDLLFSHPHDHWFVWNGCRWVKDDCAEAQRRATDTVLKIYEEVAQAKSIEEREEKEKHAKASQSSRAMEQCLYISRRFLQVTPEQFDADPMLFNCANGTIDLRTGELRPHRREDRLSQMGGVEYHGDAPCPLWESFLARVFPADIDAPEEGGNAGLVGYVQRLFGYGLTGEIREHVLPIFWGAGSNGKSTLLETAAKVFGDYWAAAPDGMLMMRKNEAHPTELARLYRKRMVAASETEEGHRLNITLVKRLTGGDTITARFMRQDFFEFPPTHKIAMATNERPRIADGGHAIWRRLALVPFAVKFWDPQKGEIGPDAYRADPTLPKRLVAELPGILAWMVRGCLEWQRIGLSPPPEVRLSTEEYRSQQNTIGSFVAEACELTNRAMTRTPLKDVYAAYRAWCQANNDNPLGKIRFNEAMQKEGVRRERDADNVDVWTGLVLRRPVHTLDDLL